MMGEYIAKRASMHHSQTHQYAGEKTPNVKVTDAAIETIIAGSGRTLRDFQYRGIRFLAERGRAMLADDPRVGKTVQALVANELLDPRDCLIVCPKGAIGVWKDEIETWLGKTARTYTAHKRNPSAVRLNGYLICNYQMVEEIIKLKSHWRTIIWDESHVMRNQKLFGYTKKKDPKTGKDVIHSHTFTHLRKLTAVNEFFLTGTPISKGAGDLWTTLNRIAPSRFPAYWPFVTTYCFKASNGFGWKYEGIRDPDRFSADVSPYMLRRRKTDVLKELPAKVRQRIPLTMTAVQQRYYIELATHMMAELDDGSFIMTPSVVSLLNKLRQLLVSPRLLDINDDGAAIAALLEDAEGSPGPSLIYTPFRAGVDFIERAMKGARWETHILKGGMREDQTSAVTSAFAKSQTERRVLIATVQMGASWDASTALYEYFLGYDWDPLINIQAEERPLGRGFKGVMMNPRYYVHEGTVDRHVLKINDRKETIQSLLMDHRNILDL
jgi:SNF2 family DNA or RNA helicase